MQVATDAEILKFLAENAWSHGIRAEGTSLYYTDPDAKCFELKWPETPLRVTHFARVAAMMGIDDEALFYGATLWITLSTIGSPQLEKSGWKLVERMRQGFGENRSLQTASGHSFRSDSWLIYLHSWCPASSTVGTPTWYSTVATISSFISAMTNTGE